MQIMNIVDMQVRTVDSILMKSSLLHASSGSWLQKSSIAQNGLDLAPALTSLSWFFTQDFEQSVEEWKILKPASVICNTCNVCWCEVSNFKKNIRFSDVVKILHSLTVNKFRSLTQYIVWKHLTQLLRITQPWIPGNLEILVGLEVSAISWRMSVLPIFTLFDILPTLSYPQRNALTTTNDEIFCPSFPRWCSQSLIFWSLNWNGLLARDIGLTAWRGWAKQNRKKHEKNYELNFTRNWNFYIV